MYIANEASLKIIKFITQGVCLRKLLGFLGYVNASLFKVPPYNEWQQSNIILIFVFTTYDNLINRFSLGFEISGFAMIEKVGSLAATNYDVKFQVGLYLSDLIFKNTYVL